MPNKSLLISVALTVVAVGFLTVGVLNAGTGPSVAPRRSSASGGCASQVQAYSLRPLSGGCSSMLAPAFQARGGCASDSRRVTLAERRMANQAARANAETTRKQFLKAASLGDLEKSVSVKTAAIQEMAPIDIPAGEAYSIAANVRQADGAPTVIVEEVEKAKPIFGFRR